MTVIPPKTSLLKSPMGTPSGISYFGAVKLPALLHAAPYTHPGYTAVLPPGAGNWSRELLDLTSLGTAVKTGLSIRAKPVVVQMQDLVLWCNGIDNVQVYEPTTGGVYDLGVATPSSAPGLANQGSGSFAGSYTYWIRWKRSSTGEYSALSLGSDHTASGSGQYVRVTWTDPSISGVDKCDICRSKTGYMGVYVIATVDVTAELYDDAIADSAIDITLRPSTRPSPGSTTSIPVFDYIAVYAQRLWGIIGNKLYWSEPNSPWLVPPTNMMNIPNERDIGSGFGKAHGTFYVSQQRHLYRVDSLDMMEGIGGRPILVPLLTEGDDSTGFASQHAVASVENTLWFLSGEGKIYQIPSERGPVAGERSSQLEETLKRLFTKRLDNAEMIYVETLRKVFVTVSLDESTHNNAVLVYDLTNKGWTVLPDLVESFAHYRDSDGRDRLVAGNVRGDINQYGVGHGRGGRAGTLSGSPTAGTKNTLTDSGAAFDSGVAGLPVSLFDASWNLLQTNMIASRDSATALTMVFKWHLVPTTTHKYVIGGAFPVWRFGWFDQGGWSEVQYVEMSFVPGAGKVGVYHATDDGEDVLMGTLDLGDGGVERVPIYQGSRRFRTTLRGLDGLQDFKVIAIYWQTGEQVEGLA